MLLKVQFKILFAHFLCSKSSLFLIVWVFFFSSCVCVSQSLLSFVCLSLSRDPLKLTLSRYDVFDWLVLFCDYTMWRSVYRCFCDAFVLLSSVSLWLISRITSPIRPCLYIWVWCSGSKGLLFFFCRSQTLSNSRRHTLFAASLLHQIKQPWI